MHLPDTEALKSFDIVIQSGAILAVLVLYGKRLIVSRNALLKTIVAFIPTGILGVLLHKMVKTYFFESTQLILWSLLIGGVILILVDVFHKEQSSHVSEIESISYKQAIALGFVQSIAMIPGVSRSGATIVGGMLMGIKRVTIVEFSFLLAIPTMLAATGLDLVKSASSFTSGDVLNLGIGFVVSFFVALVAIKWLLAYVKSHSFKWFGIYRIAVAAMFIGFF